MNSELAHLDTPVHEERSTYLAYPETDKKNLLQSSCLFGARDTYTWCHLDMSDTWTGQNSLIITCAVYGQLTWLYLCVTYWFSPAVVHAPIVSRVVICGGWRGWGVQWLTTWRTRACAPRTKLNMLRLPLMRLPCLTLQLWPMNYSLGDRMRPCASLSFFLLREESFRQPRTVTTIIADFTGSLQWAPHSPSMWLAGPAWQDPLTVCHSYFII